MRPWAPTFHALHPLFHVFLRSVCSVIPAVYVPAVVNADKPRVDHDAAVLVPHSSVADVAEPRASVDIESAFDVLAPVSAGLIEVDSFGRPKFSAPPNTAHYARFSSSAVAAGLGFVHSSMSDRTNCVLCSILSNPDLHRDKILERCRNKPSPGHNNASGTSGLPMAATTSHSRKKYQHLHQEQRIHRACQATQPQPEAPRIRWVAAEEFQCLYLHSPRPLLEQEWQMRWPWKLPLEETFSFCYLPPWLSPENGLIRPRNLDVKPRIHKITRTTKIAQRMLAPYSATKVQTSPSTTC